MNRRDFLGLAAMPLAAGAGRPADSCAPAAVIGIDGAPLDSVEFVRDWNGSFCRARLVNRGAAPLRVKEIVLFDVELALPPATALYGEGFQMLTQTAGTLAEPLDFSQYTDAKHYRIPTSDASRAYYGLLTLTPPGGDTQCSPSRHARGSADVLSVPRVFAARGARLRGPGARRRARRGRSRS